MKNFKKLNLSSSVTAALGAAVLFGGTMPLAKILVNNTHPILLAGLFYFGSGIGLATIYLFKKRRRYDPGLLKHEWTWLFYTIFFGGILGPILLMYGLTLTTSATASLLLNFEVVLTVTIAWIIFKECTDKRIVFGMLLIMAGTLLLFWPEEQITPQGWLGPLAIAGACLCWAIDNNLTRKISGADSLFLATSKGIIAGIVNISLAYSLGEMFPPLPITITILVCGFFGYGLSLILFILALRGLGTARTGAYFSVAPFIGAGIAIIFLKEEPSAMFWLAAILMSIGVWLHLSEKHEHEHTHEILFHKHNHLEDEHHQHSHDSICNNNKTHSHSHRHDPITHTHSHYPDIHHQDKHSN